MVYKCACPHGIEFESVNFCKQHPQVALPSPLLVEDCRGSSLQAAETTKEKYQVMRLSFWLFYEDEDLFGAWDGVQHHEIRTTSPPLSFAYWQNPDGRDKINRVTNIWDSNNLFWQLGTNPAMAMIKNKKTIKSCIC